MADTPPPAGLLDRAGRVFFLAREFVRTLTEHDDAGHLLRTDTASAWEQSRPAFDGLCAALEELGDERQSSPLGFDLVTEMLRRVEGIALQMHEVAQNADGHLWRTLIELCLHLEVAVANGEDVLRRAGLPVPANTSRARLERLIVPFASDSVPEAEVSEPVTIDNLLDYAVRVRDSLDDTTDLTRDESLNLIQVAKAYKAASEFGLVRASEIPETLLDNNGAKRKLDTLIPLLRARLESPSDTLNARVLDLGPAGALLRIFTNGLSDERIKSALRAFMRANQTANEKLVAIDRILPIPPTASAEQLGELLGVTKQAILKTGWWIEHRKGEKADEIGRRRSAHQKRAEGYEPPNSASNGGR
ncbi:hypothetical protein R5W23_003399 [Gemmata sp. JC673]|uniref:Uncharacterized protein n=1 Tax=Gemmata algarum TaxID=2975278 RepID=A0ABU5F4A2_9BACT|nr:hypothetical protein [Gemmata algarum]MDY3561968.1 hypothetical protein [Gemmata algarum]